MEESWWEFIIFEGVRCSLLYSFWHDLCGGKREFKSGIFIDKSVQLFHVSEEFHEISYWYLFHILHNNELLFRNSNKIDCVYQKSSTESPKFCQILSQRQEIDRGSDESKKIVKCLNLKSINLMLRMYLRQPNNGKCFIQFSEVYLNESWVDLKTFINYSFSQVILQW